MSEERLDRIEAKVDALAGDVDRRLDALGIEMRTLNQETRHEMRVLHEEVLDRIAALAPDFAPIRREFREADQILRESIEGRPEPLEAAKRARHRKA
jgi:hypothetical protein